MILLINIPCFNSGGQDGAVSIWEWAHATQVSTVRFVLLFFSLFSYLQYLGLLGFLPRSTELFSPNKETSLVFVTVMATLRCGR